MDRSKAHVSKNSVLYIVTFRDRRLVEIRIRSGQEKTV